MFLINSNVADNGYKEVNTLYFKKNLTSNGWYSDVKAVKTEVKYQNGHVPHITYFSIEMKS